MANLVLYRKYRPQSFSEVIGQEHVVKTITNALCSNMISHAYIFSGPRGSGKTTIARLLAKAVNCHKRKQGDFEPCNICSSCKEIKQGRSLDLIEIDAASHRGIDEIRDLREGIRFSPNKEKYKVFIIDESHQLTKEAVNALLKTLEEPPSHAMFVLATTEIHKMIPTIISRCQRFDFRKLTLPEIVKKLEIISKKEKAKIEKPALELIALNSSGAVRDAESLLDQVLTFGGAFKREIKVEDIKELLGLADTALIAEFIDFLTKKKGAQALSFLEKTFETGFDPQEFARALVSYLRQAMLLKMNPAAQNPMILGLTQEEQERMKTQIESLSQKEIQRAVNLFMEAESKMKYSSIPELPLEVALVDFIQEN